MCSMSKVRRWVQVPLRISGCHTVSLEEGMATRIEYRPRFDPRPEVFLVYLVRT